MNGEKLFAIWIFIVAFAIAIISITALKQGEDNEKRMAQYIEKSKLYRDYTDILEVAGDSMFVSNWWVLVEGRLQTISEMDSLENLIIKK
jgi:hypothetical protein